MEDPHTVKVIKNIKDEAIYFSRFAIPFSKKKTHKASSSEGCLDYIESPFIRKHIGLYAYTYKALVDFFHTPPCDIEKAESLEQLRALHLGAKIFIKDASCDFMGVDTPEDLKRVESLLQLRIKGKNT